MVSSFSQFFCCLPIILSRVDLYQPGVVLTTVCATTALLAIIFFIVTLLWPKNANGSLKIQAWIFTFFSVWLLVTQIHYTIFVANRSAKVDAFLAGTQLPAQAVQAALAAAGESAKYNKLHFGTYTPCPSHPLGYHGANVSPLSCPSCHFPLDIADLIDRSYPRSLCRRAEKPTVPGGNDFSAAHF